MLDIAEMSALIAADPDVKAAFVGGADPATEIQRVIDNYLSCLIMMGDEEGDDTEGVTIQ